MQQPNIAHNRFIWRITNFSRHQSETKIYSDVFTAGGCKWRVMTFPKGNNTDHLSTYLEVADSAALPSGWSIDARFWLTIVNQHLRILSATKNTRHEFTSGEVDWGFTSFKSLSEIHDSTKGFLIDDTLVLEVDIEVLTVVTSATVPSVAVPPVVDDGNRFDAFFTNLEKFITDADQGRNCAYRAGPSMNSGLNSEAPSLEEVEMAKQSLKECLSDLFKLNMKDRLATSLETLSRAKIGLSPEQQRAIQMFRAEFNDFVSDFLTFEQDNSEFELQKLGRDQIFSSMKKNHETHLSNKKLMDVLNNEEEELMKRMEDVKSRKAKLMSDWERLMIESGETKAKYTAQEKKLAEAEEKKRIAEERMSRSTTAWSSLKSHFV